MNASLCLILSATLIIHPNKLQFFWYDNITLSCETVGNSRNWVVKRNTSSKIEPCSDWGLPDKTPCTIEHAFPSDSGKYWCESERGESSNSITITVNAGVILDSPALPVTEGDNVTLACHHKKDDDSKAASSFSANFYKNGDLIGIRADGKMTFAQVSKRDEGFYKCMYPGKGESAQSWMSVRNTGGLQPSPCPALMTTPRIVCVVLLITVYTVLSVVCLAEYRMWTKHKKETKM